MGARINIDEKRFLELYEQGLGERKIANLLGVGRTVIQRYRTKIFKLKPNLIISSIDIDKLKELASRGYSDREIQSELGSTKSNISFLRAKHFKKYSREESQQHANKNFKYYNILEDTFLVQVICGTLLGDATLQKSSINSGKLTFAHKESHKEYLEYKANLLKPIFSSIRYRITKTNPFIKLEGRLINPQNQYWFYSKCNPDLLKIKDILYCDNGKKKITKEFLELMGEISIALYFFDDGSKIVNKKRDNWWYYKIACYAFDTESKELLTNWMKEKFGIESTYTKDVIYIRSNSKDKFTNIIKKYSCECMKYKI